MRRFLVLAAGLFLLLASGAPTAVAEPPNQPPTHDPDPPEQGENDTRDPPGNDTRDPDDNRTGENEDDHRGPPNGFPGPGGFPANPGERFPAAACDRTPQRPSDVPSWVPLPYDGCRSGDESG